MPSFNCVPKLEIVMKEGSIFQIDSLEERKYKFFMPNDSFLLGAQVQKGQPTDA